MEGAIEEYAVRRQRGAQLDSILTVTIWVVELGWTAAREGHAKTRRPDYSSGPRVKLCQFMWFVGVCGSSPYTLNSLCRVRKNVKSDFCVGRNTRCNTPVSVPPGGGGYALPGRGGELWGPLTKEVSRPLK
jgi:hypothetical protein